MPRALDPARHCFIGLHLRAGGDVLAGRAVAVTGALDALRRIGTVAAAVAEVVVARHVLGMQPGGSRERVVPAHRRRRLERPVAAAARRGARAVDEIEHALSRRLRGHRHRRRERRGDHDPELALVQVNADLCQSGVLQLRAITRPCQDSFGARVDPLARDVQGARPGRPVAVLLFALLQVGALRQVTGDALERGLRLQRRQVFRGRAIASAGAQPVDRGVKIARRCIQRHGKQQQAGKDPGAHA